MIQTALPLLHQVGVDTREWLIGHPAAPELGELRIELCGLSEARLGFTFARHGWNRSQVLVCHGGRGEVLVEGEWQELLPGQAYLTPVGCVHAYRAVVDMDWHLAWATSFDPPGLDPLLTPGPAFVATVDPRGFTDAISNLYREVMTTNQPAVRSHWVSLIALLASRFCTPDTADRRLDRVWEEVDRDLARPWTLNDLARLAELGPEQLRRRCLRQLGRSPMHHVTWLRLQRAATLLSAARGTVGDIASAVGYDNAFAFSTAFKRLYGVPPSAWRK